MNLDFMLEPLGDRSSIALIGLLTGTLFGFFAQRSRFCLRSATLEFWRRSGTEKLAVWLFAFSTAVLATQLFSLLGWFDASTSRQLSSRGSLSGALVGGLLFGIGMVLARGCSSRMLVLAANGNLRALLAGLIFAVTAQAALAGILAPARLWIASWWTVAPETRNLLGLLGLGHGGGLLFGLLWAAAALFFARRARLFAWGLWGGIGVGFMVALAWLLTYQVSQQAFEPIPVEALSFTGPSASTLMLFLSPPGQPLDFDLGLVPGVALGSFTAAWRGKELKLEGFKDGHSMRRYIFGAMSMGFGGMLAGGCAVGAGVSGAAIFALTAWLTLIGMWLGAGLTDWLVDKQGRNP